MAIGHGECNRLLARILMLSVGTLLAATLAARIATAAEERVLYSFCAQAVGRCDDGAEPYAGLIMDAAGNLYGTTESGGTAAGARCSS